MQWPPPPAGKHVRLSSARRGGIKAGLCSQPSSHPTPELPERCALVKGTMMCGPRLCQQLSPSGCGLKEPGPAFRRKKAPANILGTCPSLAENPRKGGVWVGVSQASHTWGSCIRACTQPQTAGTVSEPRWVPALPFASCMPCTVHVPVCCTFWPVRWSRR